MSQHSHMYNNSRWRKARQGYLRKHPLCVYCEKQGKTVEATVVDHIKPHKGDTKLFWDKSNWQALCKPCHDRHKQRQERSGTLAGAGLDGLPIDPSHHWNGS